MTFANKYNKTTAHYTYVFPTKPEYKKLSELYDKNDPEKIFMVYGLYVSEKGQYGAQPIAASDAYIINLPSHLLDAVRAMRQDPELTEAINCDRFGFKIRPYIPKGRKKTAFTVEWVDVN